MAQVEIADLRAVAQKIQISVRQRPTAPAGGGGENADVVCEDGIVDAEVDAPDDFRFRQSLAELLHAFVGNTAAVHVERRQPPHASGNVSNQLSFVCNMNVA